MARRHVGAGLVLLLLALGSAQAGEEEDRADEALCRDARVGTDGPALLAFFKARTLTALDRDKLGEFVGQLGSDDFAEREAASQAILKRGPLAVPFLNKALHSADAEVVRRARACLEAINEGPGPALPGAAARLLGRRKPDGAVAVLLAYAPYADDATVEDEVCAALAAVGRRDGEADAVLVAALGDREPARRAAAAQAVGKLAGVAHKDTLARLARDTSPGVRYRAALGLLSAGHREGLGALIGLLGDGQQELADRAEEVLLRLAGEQSPHIERGDDETVRRKRRQAAWEDWRREHGARADLARLTTATPYLGYLLVVQPNAGKIWEQDRAGKVRFQITGLSRPHYAQMLPGGRVLVSEHDTHRVTERDLHGKVLWSHPADDARFVERLPSGNTFIGTVSRAFEVTPAGKEIWAFPLTPGEGSHLGVYRKPDGNVVAVSMAGKLSERDRSGKVVRTISLPGGHWCGVQALPNGHYLAAELRAGLVVETDTSGKIVWECKVPGAVQALRRPNGRTLICSYEGQRLVEVDRSGKIVWEKACGSQVWRARER